MRKSLIFVLLFLTFQVNYSQENYTIDGETLELKTELEGNLDLLWTSIDGTYRYFVKTKDDSITELKNTKGDTNSYLEQYKTTLSNLTNGADTEKLKFTLYDLKKYIDDYNKTSDSAYNSDIKDTKVEIRLGFFGGLTNNPFVDNPKNTNVLLIGGELEIFESTALPRHSGFLQARHTFDADNFNYSTNEAALGYRYRIMNKSKFSIYGQVKLATLNFSSSTFEDANGNQENEKSTTFDAPFIFGIGADLKIGNNSYLTLAYGEIFALFLNNQGNFSTDFSIGYKFGL